MGKKRMIKSPQVKLNPNIIYELHHALDPVILQVANRVLKLKCFKRAHEHFKWDMLNDIGIINLLRKDYLRHGSIVKTFKLYQGTRLDQRSQRYESIFALLVVSIVGAVVAGVIIENYKDNKSKLSMWLGRMKEEAGLFGTGDKISNIFATVFKDRNKIRHIDKFCSSTAEQLLEDFSLVLKCFIARQMHDVGLISYANYTELLEHFLAKSKSSKATPTLAKFKEFYQKYSVSTECIEPKKVFMAIEAYGKGTIAKKLETVGAKLNLPENTDTADWFHGLPASPGAILGIGHVFGYKRTKTKHPIILVVDSAKFTPGNIDCLTSSSGAVTTNCGMTGHVPVICRGLGIGCVVVPFSDFSRIRNGNRIGICGKTGIVATGLLIKI